MTDEILLKKKQMVLDRIFQALKEYASNWSYLDNRIEKNDLITYIREWSEEFAKEKTEKDRLLELATLMSNLEIQLDFLRSNKGWKKIPSEQLPEVLETLSNQIKPYQ